MEKQKTIEEMARIICQKYHQESGRCLIDGDICDIGVCKYCKGAKSIIAAGLRKQTTCQNISKMHPTDEFICSECEFMLSDFVEKRVDEDNGDITYYEYEIKYCPNCGAKVVEETYAKNDK